MDNYHKGSGQGPTFDRVKIDIQHLDLGELLVNLFDFNTISITNNTKDCACLHRKYFWSSGLLPCIQEKKKRVVGIGKHLCGGATDLMLRCITKSSQ